MKHNSITINSEVNLQIELVNWKAEKMAPLGNGIFVVRVEMSTMMTTMKRSTRWNNNASSYQVQADKPCLSIV